MVFKKIGNWFNKNVKVSSLLESKVVLYILVFISIVNLYSYAMEDDLVYAAIIIIVGFLSSFFNKNMIIILFTAITVTNLIRFSVESVNREGFTGDLSQLDNLMQHLTGNGENKSEKQPDESEELSKIVEQEISANKDVEQPKPPVSDEMISNKNASINKDPSKRDVEIDNFIKKLNLSGALKEIEGKMDVFDVSKIGIVKDKTDTALKYTEQIANVEQRKSVESILTLQKKLLDKVLTLAPLIDEFREVVKNNNV